MLKFTILFFIIIKLISVSFAEDNISVEDLINKQLKIIEEQDKRIKNLENIVNELKNKIDNQNVVNNANESPSTPSSNSEQNLSESSNESEIGSSSSQKVYNPEKAFFGATGRWFWDWHHFVCFGYAKLLRVAFFLFDRLRSYDHYK